MTDDIPPVSAPEAVRVFRFKRQNVSLRGEVPNPPVTTLFMAFDPLPGTSYTGEDGRWLPVDAYDALVAERNALREKAERALSEVTCLRMSLRALSSLHPTHDVEYARTAAKRHEDNSWARYPVDAYGAALGAERAT